jgi:ABC-2 type transport system permease protein
VTALLRPELLKQRSTWTNLGLLSAMLRFVLLAVLLHGFALPAEHVETSSDQLTLVVGWGEKLGVLFAGLLGAMSITSEIRTAPSGQPSSSPHSGRGSSRPRSSWACSTAAASG